jgi:replication factor C small subunit
MYINASDENKVDDVRNKIKTFASSVGFKSLKVIILDECDYLTPNAQAALRNLMETFSKHCRFILTCNYVERIIDPIQSRCQSYKVVPPSKKEVAQHMVSILDSESVKYELDDVALIVNAGYPDIRRVINSAQRQVVDGKLKIDVSSVIQNNYKVKLLDMLSNGAKFNDIRQLIADNSITDYEELYRLLYDEVETYSNGKIAECILAIAEGEYRDVQVVDKEINFMSTIIKLMRI